MSTANLTWTPQAGATNQQVWYGKSSVVTGTPLAGTGWTAWTGNPLSAATNSLSIPGLDNFFRYRFIIYSVMPGGGMCPTEITDISFICPVIDYTIDNVAGQLNYSVTFPSGLVGSDIASFSFQVWGTSPGGVTQFFVIDIPQPLTGVISGGFDVTGATSWNMIPILNGINIEDGKKCQSIPFTTTDAPGKKNIRLRNGMISRASNINKFYIDDVDPATLLVFDGALPPGNTTDIELTAADMGVDRWLGIQMNGLTVLTAGINWSVLRGLTTIYAGTFDYDGVAGGNQPISPDPVQFQPDDIIIISPSGGFIPVGRLADINNDVYSDGYLVQTSISQPQGVDKTFSIGWTAVDTHGNIESFNRDVTIPAGQVWSNVVQQPSGLAGWPRALVLFYCITPQDVAIEVPDEYNCAS